MEREEILLSDLSVCEPSSAVTRRSNTAGTWMLFDYETEGGTQSTIAGTMVYGAGRIDSPAIRLPLPARGWYSIHIGMWHDIHMGGSHLRLKLEQDRYYRQFGPEKLNPKDVRGIDPELMKNRDGSELEYNFGATDLTESFWRVACLAEGENLVIDRVRVSTYVSVRDQASDPGACLAYVRLTPATEEDRDRYFGRGRTREPKIQFAQYDNGNWWQMGCTSEDDIRASLDWFRDTDQTRINWGCYSGEGACYPSRHCQQKGRDPEVTGCLDAFFSRGVDPMAVAVEYANQIGLLLYPSFRIGGKRPAPAVLTTNEMPFFDSHQHCISVAPDGTPTPHYSFAYDEVREFFVNVVREAAENYDVPGVHFIFGRSNPFVLYEEKTVREFGETHGLNAHDLAEDDERWLTHRASYLTRFVRELRQALDEVGSARGRPVELAVSVPATPAVAREWVVDSLTWAREKLVDYLILHAGGVTRIEDLHFHVEALEGVDIPIVVDFYPRRMPARARLLRALEYYEAGADGFCFWDSQARVTRASEFATDRFLGHREDLGQWAQEMETPFRVLPLKTLQGYTLDRRFWTLTSG